MTNWDELSVTGRKWRLRAQAQDHHQQIIKQLILPPVLAPLLASRQLESMAQAKDFLNPRLNQLTDPLSLKDMDKAVERLVQALKKNQSIAIFGDYDVDGATSSAIMVRYFRMLGIDVRVYIPSRKKEGYGPNPAAMEMLKGEGIDLVVTVDCGITAFEALDKAQQLGLDVVVTDHHQQAPEGVPKAIAVVNPNRLDDDFPHKNLAGVGVAFHLLMALNRSLREQGWFSQRPEPELKTILDLVAVGTVADVVPLSGVNRPLVAAGLRQANGTSHAGLRALYETAGIKGSLSVGQVGFQVGPRINAGGRLDQESLGWTILSTEDPRQAENIAQILEAANQERRRLEDDMLKSALADLKKRDDIEDHRGLVVSGQDWHPGVIGIVASRIVDVYHRPTIVIAFDEHGLGKASARSIPGIDLLSAIRAADEHLLTYGGHKAAAGLSIKREHLDAFSVAFDQALRDQNAPEAFQPVLKVDAPIAATAIDNELIRLLERFQPFGMGNPEPVFVVDGVRISERRVLKDRHVKCRLSGGQGAELDAIAFQVLPGALGEMLMHETRLVRVAGTLSLNRFRGQETVQMMVRDIALS
ncbi:MAG: single-stranded-DNA-specific exonuclease RecJ [Magnetococcales bacterium]|nr:single-stranded-DNA-specific exonuclease RecJ [Magnetococcales bacterium]